MLIGEHQTKLVSGNRVVIPSFIRQEFKESDLIVTKGYESCLILLNQSLWKQLTADLVNKSYFQSNVRDTLRFLVGGASQISLDNQGRVVFLPPHMEKLDIQVYNKNQPQTVVFVGLLNWVEIWELKNWQKRNAYLNENGQAIADELMVASQKNNEN